MHESVTTGQGGQTTTIIVLDLETARSAEDCRHCGMAEAAHGFHSLCETPLLRGIGARFTAIGWENKAALGLSIGCYYDYRDHRVHWFDAQTLADTLRYLVDTQPLLVSFNGIAFDFPLMRGLLRERAEEAHATPLACLCDAFKALCETSYDILAEIWRVDPGRKFERGLNSLEAIARANGYGGKVSHGAEAPRRWARGEYAHVLNYCQDDVLKTKALFEQILQTGTILRGDGQPLALPRPAGLSLHGGSLIMPETPLGSGYTPLPGDIP